MWTHVSYCTLQYSLFLVCTRYHVQQRHPNSNQSGVHSGCLRIHLPKYNSNIIYCNSSFLNLTGIIIKYWVILRYCFIQKRGNSSDTLPFTRKTMNKNIWNFYLVLSWSLYVSTPGSHHLKFSSSLYEKESSFIRQGTFKS